MMQVCPDLEKAWFPKLIPTMNATMFKLSRPFVDKLFQAHSSNDYDFKEVEVKGIRVCIYEPIHHEKRPGILWLHGGGYALGKPEMDVGFIQRFVKYGCTVVLPDYTLSIDAPYPQALLECYETLIWMKENADALGIDENKLVVGGESAGGGLCIALCLYARDHREIKIALQMPIYPMMDPRATNTNTNTTAYVWNALSNRQAWDLYLGKYRLQDNMPYYAAPARAKSYQDMPPCISYVGTIDCFYAETKTYVERLTQEGICTYFKEYEGCYHAFDMLVPHANVSKDAKNFFEASFVDAMKI